MDAANKLVLDLYDIAQHARVEEFTESALRSIKRLLHFDSAAVVDFAISAQQKVHIRAVQLHQAPMEKLRDRLAKVDAEAPVKGEALRTRDTIMQTAFLQRGRSLTAAVSEVFSDREILAYCHKYETAHSLAFVGDASWGLGHIPGVALWRGNRRNNYLPEQAQLADILLPHLCQAKRIHTRLAGAAFGEPDGAHSVIASMDGCIQVADPATFGLFQREWSQWSPPFLPLTLMDALRSHGEMRFTGKHIAVRAQMQGALVCLLVTGRRDNGTELLTAAERRVAQLAASGKQYKEIANAIGVSPSTVRNQLHEVYRKLGVPNKAALAALLARRQLLGV